MYEPKSGHVGEGEFWSSGKMSIWRFCDRVFELRCNGVAVMPVGTFEQVERYLRLEFGDLVGVG